MKSIDLEDIPFEVRAALFSMCLSREATQPLTQAMERLHMAHHYHTFWAQIKGATNLTPNTLLLLCQAYNDYTPLHILLAAHEIPITVNQEHPHSDDIVLETAEATEAVGKLHGTLVAALQDKQFTAKERAAIARQAQRAIEQLSDVVAAASTRR